MRLGPKICRLFAVLLAMWLAGATAYARTPTIEICVTKLATGQDVQATMAQPGRFDCNIRQNSLGAGNFLTELRFAPRRMDVEDPLVLRIASVWQDSATITFRYADGTTAQTGFTSANLHRFMTVGAILEFPVPVRPADLQSIFIETRGSSNVRGVILSPQLKTRTESYALKLGLVAVFAAFAGLAVALFTYNMSLWVAMRHSFQLWYCAMVTTFLLHTASSSGLLMMIAPGLDNNDRLRINYVLLALVGGAALQFIRHFFGDSVFGKRLEWAAIGSIGLALFSSLLFSVLAPWQVALLDRFYFVAMTLMLSVVVPVVISAWRSRNRYFWMFILAWSAPILTSALRAAHGFNLIEQSFLLDNSNLFALFLEALLSSLLVTARLRELSIERDHAIRGEQTARRLAATDPLTGLMNRRAFIDLAIGRTGRYRLMLIDIDHFKAVNDRLGHEAGDQVLRAVANVIQRCRPHDSLAVRLGGEEFALLVPRSAYEQCRPDMVLEAVRSEPMPQGTSVTVSIGYADGSVISEENWKRLYRLADAALYRAKADGRDRSCRATDFRAAA